MRTTKLSEEVLTVLSTASIEGNCVKLTCGQLDRKLYQDVNKALEAIGGKWNRKAQGHIFASDPEEALDNAILTGEVTPPSKNGYFPTPNAIVMKLCDLADIQPGQCILEPSAGQGAISTELYHRGAKVFACELLEANRKVLMGDGMPPTSLFSEPDFTKLETQQRFDRVAMNPPFEKRQDILHVMRAFSMLKPGGKLVSVMSAGVKFRDDALGREFREFVELHNGEIMDLPEGSFKESGTGVSTVIVVMDS
ncbi:MAG: SAM-dependent methyltransferase [Dehalococcoidia bacterium]|jgi:16S rRNA G966 N2-methylase RsmD